MAGTRVEPKVNNWRAVCLSPGCLFRLPSDGDQDYVEAMAVLHKVNTGHEVLLIGTVGTSPVEEVSSINQA